MLTVEQRIQRGIAYLDLFGPENWRDLIQKQYISMSSVHDCIAGQIFGNYHNMPNLHRFNRADYGFTQNEAEEVAYGNAVDAWYDDIEIEEPMPMWGEALRDEWIKQLSV
jgi:hypothetical protein